MGRRAGKKIDKENTYFKSILRKNCAKKNHCDFFSEILHSRKHAHYNKNSFALSEAYYIRQSDNMCHRRRQACIINKM